MDDLPELEDLLGEPGKKARKGHFNSTTTIECKNCNQKFLLKRKWQSFCSDICRAGFHRRELMAAKDRHIAELEQEIKRLEAENLKLKQQLGL